MSETVLPVFTKEMKATHTILVPNMLPFHFALLRSALQSCGYKAEILQNTGRNVIETGLKYVNSDICYPALLVIGQIISALESGRYDLSKTAVMLSQTQNGRYAQPDRRRLPRFQLYISSAQRYGKSRPRQCANHQP